MRSSRAFVRRRCPICGSRRFVPQVSHPRMVAESPPPIAGGSEDATPNLHWRCLSCRAKVDEDPSPSDVGLWQRRRPIASWLFGR